LTKVTQDIERERRDRSDERGGASVVTKAMEAAGALAFEEWANVLDPRALVTKVYIAMLDAASEPSGPIPASRRSCAETRRQVHGNNLQET
jgi:hypothetical protein